MQMVCLDLEGVLIPEIWIAFANKTGIEDLKRTTRDEPDYGKLMRYRLDILDQAGLKLNQVHDVIDSLDPLPGACEFLDWLQARGRVVILSDTFEEFSGPLMLKLGHPTLFCHSLIVEPDGRIADYKLRLENHKQKAVEAFRDLNFHVVANAKGLFTGGRKPYSEFSLGLDNIGIGKWRFLRIDYVKSNFNGKKGDGFLFGISF